MLADIRTDLKKVDLPNEIEIYGMGLVGESFYYLIKNICMVKCFIDRNGGHFDLPVIRTNEYVWSGRKIIVTPTFFFEEIRKDLISAGVEENSIISLRDLLIT